MYSTGQRLGAGVVATSLGVAHGEAMAVKMKKHTPAKNEVEQRHERNSCGVGMGMRLALAKGCETKTEQDKDGADDPVEDPGECGAGADMATEHRAKKTDEREEGKGDQTKTNPKKDKLLRNGALLGADELREERQKEQRDLWVEHVHEERLGKNPFARKCGSVFRQGDESAREDYPDAEVNQIGSAEELRDREGGG